MARWLALACMLGGCRTYIAAGYDTTAKVHGPLANLVAAPVAARTISAAAPAPAPAPSGDNVSLAVGGGARDFTIELGLHVHDVTSQTFALPDPATLAGTPHYMTTSTSLDMRWTWLRTHHVAAHLHVGPAAALLVDRSSGATSLG